MYYKDGNGIKKIIKRLEKMPGINDKNREYWKKRTLHWHKTKQFYDHEIKTGVCYFCDREGKAQGSKSTALHHVIYNNDDPLEWTIEVCIKCHSKVDPNNLKQIQRSSSKRYFAKGLDREDWYMRYCMNIGGKFEPNNRLIPDQETFDKVVEAIKKASSKRNTVSDVSQNTMSDVSHRYF